MPARHDRGRQLALEEIMGLNIGRLARRAVRWLSRATRKVEQQAPPIRTAIAVLEDVLAGNAEAQSLFRDLREIETTIGAHTSVWGKVADAARAHTGAELTTDEVRYLALFKGAFDRHVKAPALRGADPGGERDELETAVTRDPEVDEREVAALATAAAAGEAEPDLDDEDDQDEGTEETPGTASP